MLPLSGLLHDGIDGSLSSKRVVTFSAFMLCAVAFLANLFYGLKIEAFIFDTMSYIAMAGLGATAMEKFSSRTPIQSAFQQSQPAPVVPTPYVPAKIRGTPLPFQEQKEL